jgi:dolichol-phosphate mannosyltransferase
MIKIIFCAFNEAQNLRDFLPSLSQEMQSLKRDFEILACLDGGFDNSPEILEKFAVKILPIKNERGLGKAYKRLFEEVIKNSSEQDLVISLDADSTHNPKQITEMLAHFEKNNLDFLVASRFCKNSVMADFPLHRRFISKSTSILLQQLFPIKKISGEALQDYTSGYRIYRAKKLQELFAKEKNKFITEVEFTYTCELLIKLSRLENFRADEIEIAYDYGKKIGKSKLRIMRNLCCLALLLIKLAR